MISIYATQVVRKKLMILYAKQQTENQSGPSPDKKVPLNSRIDLKCVVKQAAVS